MKKILMAVLCTFLLLCTVAFAAAELKAGDTVYKCMLRQYGGFGYEHIAKHILPFMRLQGYQEEWLKQMTVENPKNVFSFDD